MLLQAWLGLRPMDLVMSGVAAATTYVATPHNPKEDSAILQIWLQVCSHALCPSFTLLEVLCSGVLLQICKPHLQASESVIRRVRCMTVA